MCYIADSLDFVQADFAHESNTYRIKAKDKETLISIIEKMRRYSNEER